MWGWHSRQQNGGNRTENSRCRKVRMAEQKAEDGEDGTADSTGWWGWHRG